MLIAREAGADVVDLDGTPHNLHSAATPGLTAELIALIQTALAAHPG